MVLSIAANELWPPKVSLHSGEVTSPTSSDTCHPKSRSTMAKIRHQHRLWWFRWFLVLDCCLLFGLYDSLKPIIVGDSGSAFVSFFLGWSVTIVSGLASYPIDTIRRRMMMTSGGGVKYNGAIDCGTQILKNEGFMSMMKGAGANVLRGVAGAGVLAGFDKFKEIYIAWRLANA